jgi:hypothetical protein
MIETYDGEIFVDGAAPPPPPTSRTRADGEGQEWGTGVSYYLPATTATATVVYERVLLKMRDPTTPPKVKKTCAKWAKPWPGSKICVGWKLEYKWFNLTATLRVTTAKPVDIKSAVEDCLKEGAIIALLTGIATGGSAAAAAAAAAIEACLYRKLAANLLNVSIDLSHEWDDNWG